CNVRPCRRDVSTCRRWPPTSLAGSCWSCGCLAAGATPTTTTAPCSHSPVLTDRRRDDRTCFSPHGRTCSSLSPDRLYKAFPSCRRSQPMSHAESPLLVEKIGRAHV